MGNIVQDDLLLEVLRGLPGRLDGALHAPLRLGARLRLRCERRLRRIRVAQRPAGVLHAPARRARRRLRALRRRGARAARLHPAARAGLPELRLGRKMDAPVAASVQVNQVKPSALADRSLVVCVGGCLYGL